jgi:ribose/xylose/arabinose/galactoside ABC-type transport system permease subunit/ABC-type sugar transport system substrate-binding protein
MSVEGFLTPSNLLTSARNFSFIALVALGATVVIISGGIDLSVGSVMGLSAVVTATLMQSGQSAGCGVLAGLATGLLCGGINGLLVTYLRLSPFVVTLGMLSIARSLAVVVSNNRTLFQLGPDQELFLSMGSAKLTPLVVLAIAWAALGMALHWTPWGRYVHALGGNEEAAHRTGVNVNAVKIGVYVLSGGTAALAGLLMVAWLGSVSSSLGTGYELTVVAASVIGGTQLTGGSGSLVGAVVGAALLEVIRNGLTLSGINPYWQGAFVGGCIILAVTVDSLKRQLQTRQRRSSAGARMTVAAAATAAAALIIVVLRPFSAAPASSKRVFAVVPKFMNHPFFEQAKQGCERAAAEMGDAECLFIGPNEPSEQVQIQILQDLVTRKVSGIAVAPANSSAVGRALALARDAGIPVVTWDSDLLPKDHELRRAYIGTENYKLGVELGKLLLSHRPSGGTYAMLSGGAAAENLNERMKGVRDTLAGKGFEEVAGTPAFCNDDSALAIQQMEDILGKYPRLNAFVSVGAWPLSVQRAYRGLAEKHIDRIRSNDLVVLSADTLPMQLEIVRDRLAHGLVGQRPSQMGYAVMFALRDILQGKRVSDPTFTGLDICVPGTIDTCIAK